MIRPPTIRPLRGGFTLFLLVLTLAGCQGDSGKDSDPPAGKPPGPTAPPPAGAPNILVILVDDLGYADLGVMGSEIRTPKLDELARSGVLLTDFHTTPVCFATRAALLTGLDHHSAGFAAPAASFAKARNQREAPAYAGHINPRAVMLPELLRRQGYHTYMSGKWDLGSSPSEQPPARGFERSWALLNGGASHFDDAVGLVVMQRGAHYVEDGQPVSPPASFYSSSFYTDQMIRYLTAQPDDGRPFFAYAAYTAPHWPLQVPDAWLDRYAGAYAAGYEDLHRRRLARMQALGLVPAEAAPQPRPPQLPPWSELSAEEQRQAARRMELYAAMVELLDQEIGRLLDWIAASRFAQNTLVVFLSDNGPEGNSIERLPLNRLWVPLAFDNSPDNLGRENSYSWTGAGWAQASATPFRLYKAYPTEGGYRVPAIIAFPGQFAGGRHDGMVLDVTDLSATLLDFAGVAHPGGSSTDAPRPLEGKSFRGRLLDADVPPPNAGQARGFELFGRRAVRRDQWKALNLAKPFGTGEWELFDLSVDPGESRNLAASQPQVLAELTAGFDAYAHAVGVVLPDGGERAYADPKLP